MSIDLIKRLEKTADYTAKIHPCASSLLREAAVALREAEQEAIIWRALAEREKAISRGVEYTA